MSSRTRLLVALMSLLAPATLIPGTGFGQGAPDAQGIANRGDIRFLPDPLKQRIVKLAQRPHTFLPMTAFAEAPHPSQLFQFYLLDTKNFEPNVFTSTIEGINSGTAPTATGPNGDLPTIAAVRVVLEPKPGLPTDPKDPGAFIDIFTDISGLFVINNESGWYEGWMIHDLVVPPVGHTRPDGTAQFGTLTADDAALLAAMGGGQNVPGNIFTTDGNEVRFPGPHDQFPHVQTNVVPVQLSMGAYNCLQQSDCHSYWEFNQYTNWVFPEYELAFTGGFGNAFAEGKLAFLTSVVPGSGPSGTGPTGPGPAGNINDPRAVGDNPFDPRDPDRGPVSSLDDPDRPMPPDEENVESRLRFVPSGLADEILQDVYTRLASFEPGVMDKKKRLFDAYAKEVARVDENGDGIVSFEEGDLEGTSDGQSNERLFVPATKFNRFAVTRELDDGLLAPRFAPSQRAWVLTGQLVPVVPSVDASVPRDADDR